MNPPKEENATSCESESFTKTQPSEKLSVKDARLMLLKTLLKKRRERERPTTVERNIAMRSESNGQEKTENDKGPTPGNSTSATGKQTPRRSEIEGTVETPRALSVVSRIALEQGTLDSMTLLHRSANKLMSLMEESVSLSDLEKSKAGDKRVEPHRIDQAIQAAQALASTVQTQANLMKAYSGYLK